MSPRTVVLDKSYLQGASLSSIRRLASTHRLLMTEALLYELLSNPNDRRGCFGKLPPSDNPVDIVMHSGYFLSKEIQTRKKAPLPSKSVHRLRFKFNEALLGDGYVLPASAAQALEDQNRELMHDVATLKIRAASMPSFFPDLASPNSGVRQAARLAAERAVTEPGSLRDFYASLKAPKGNRKSPPIKIVTDDWALYRWLQIDFLFCIDLFFRFGPVIEGSLSPAAEEQLEHDVLDAQYLLVGILERSFATHEKKLRRWFEAIVPDGQLL